MAKHNYEGGKLPAEQSEGERKMNAAIRGAFRRNRVVVDGDLPKKPKPKEKPEAVKHKWDDRHVPEDEGIDGQSRSLR
ncbi:MAG: hypothetical protein H0W90_08075 [Actinobacteria bacterium]|nr:hypothetical protein [Actinomycetota bacterium]